MTLDACSLLLQLEPPLFAVSFHGRFLADFMAVADARSDPVACGPSVGSIRHAARAADGFFSCQHRALIGLLNQPCPHG
jgi:hypothetical protein